MRIMTDPKRAHDYFAQKMSFTTGPAELKRWLDAGEPMTVVDVRRREDYEAGHIPGAISLPRESWRAAPGLSREKISVVYCYTQECHLAGEACLILSRLGYPVMELEGGIEGWRHHELPLERELEQQSLPPA